ncbi:hypothetical protein B0H67DRAFT_489348 [Lasiosphaeris hirsuta]|uniref:Haloacid dehalogenase n=1 Tax=Lasiosphaeris hirsuta TaxID=260670 RepID=A0AA40DTZ7_9PEZI|nr:hypothetical protein B0H67DRAFT_489348 [Lasiosphaeris hirsuta]
MRRILPRDLHLRPLGEITRSWAKLEAAELSPPNLLVCFDAFGTLFRPREPIAQTYLRKALECGAPPAQLNVDLVNSSFRVAFSRNSETYPNYGRASGMRTNEWWTKVIHDTFRPLLAPHDTVPVDLAPKLFAHFATDAGYLPAATPLPSLLAALRPPRPGGGPRVVTGVLTNSDDRVPGILASLRVRVSPLRAGFTPPPDEIAAHRPCHVDFCALSYDVGATKPDPGVFRAAEGLAAAAVTAGEGEQDGLGRWTGGKWEGMARDWVIGDWVRVYVGDEKGKDVKGALAAGWNAVLIDPEGTSGIVKGLGDGHLRRLSECFAWPAVLAAGGEEPVVLRAKSLSDVLKWLAPS